MGWSRHCRPNWCAFTHAGIAAGVVGRSVASVCCLSICLSICLFVRALTGKRLELSTQNLVHVYSTAVARQAFTPRSKGQRSKSHGYENHHGRTVAIDACCYGRVLLLSTWICMSIRLPMFSSCWKRLTLSLCSLRLTMTAVICWSRKTRMVANSAGRIATIASHHGSIDPGFTRNESLYARHKHNFDEQLTNKIKGNQEFWHI